MSSLLGFNRVYRLEIQSVMLVFSTGFVYYCHSNLLSLPSPPPLFCVDKYTCIYVPGIQCVRGGGGR
jgi:hypothetical protein